MVDSRFVTRVSCTVHYVSPNVVLIHPLYSGKTVAIGKITRIIDRNVDELADGVAGVKIDATA